LNIPIKKAMIGFDCDFASVIVAGATVSWVGSIGEIISVFCMSDI
jgi:hypothetical protein